MSESQSERQFAMQIRFLCPEQKHAHAILIETSLSDLMSVFAITKEILERLERENEGKEKYRRLIRLCKEFASRL